MAITALGKLPTSHGRFVAPSQLFDELQSAGLEPDTVTYNRVVSVLMRRGDRAGALDWFNRLVQSDLPLDHISYNIRITLADTAAEAEEWFSKMTAAGVVPEANTYNIMLSLHTRAKDGAQVQAWYDRMLAAKVQPDRVTYNALMTASGREPHMVEQWFQRMKDENIEPSAITYLALLKAYAHRQQPDKVAATLVEMQQAGCQPDRRHYNHLIAAHAFQGHLAEAEVAMATMKTAGHEPTSASYNLLIVAACNSGEYDRVAQFIEQMTSSTLGKPDSYTRKHLAKAVSALLVSGKQAEAMELERLAENLEFRAPPPIRAGRTQPKKKTG